MANELDQSLAQFKFCSFCDGSKCKSETSIKASGIFFGCNLHFSLLYNSYYFLILSTVSILLINIFCFKDECDLYILFIIVLKKSFFIFFFFNIQLFSFWCVTHQLHVACRLSFVFHAVRYEHIAISILCSWICWQSPILLDVQIPNFGSDLPTLKL